MRNNGGFGYFHTIGYQARAIQELVRYHHFAASINTALCNVGKGFTLF